MVECEENKNSRPDMRPGAYIYGPDSSESGGVGDQGENPRRILTHSHPGLTPVSKILTHITHTHPKIKTNAILELRAH